MASQISELRAKANELLKKAKKMEEQNTFEFGKAMLALINSGDIKDQAILKKALDLGLVEEATK